MIQNPVRYLIQKTRLEKLLLNTISKIIFRGDDTPNLIFEIFLFVSSPFPFFSFPLIRYQQKSYIERFKVLLYCVVVLIYYYLLTSFFFQVYTLGEFIYIISNNFVFSVPNLKDSDDNEDQFFIKGQDENINYGGQI